MRWPWQRRPAAADTEPAAAVPAGRARAGADVRADPAPARTSPPPRPSGWAFHAPLQRTIATEMGIHRGTAEGWTATGRAPGFTGAMSHLVSPASPSGVIDGDGAGVGPGSGTPQHVGAPVVPPRAPVAEGWRSAPGTTTATGPGDGAFIRAAAGGGVPVLRYAVEPMPLFTAAGSSDAMPGEFGLEQGGGPDDVLSVAPPRGASDVTREQALEPPTPAPSVRPTAPAEPPRVTTTTESSAGSTAAVAQRLAVTSPEPAGGWQNPELAAQDGTVVEVPLPGGRPVEPAPPPVQRGRTSPRRLGLGAPLPVADPPTTPHRSSGAPTAPVVSRAASPPEVGDAARASVSRPLSADSVSPAAPSSASEPAAARPPASAPVSPAAPPSASEPLAARLPVSPPDPPSAAGPVDPAPGSPPAVQRRAVDAPDDAAAQRAPDAPGAQRAPDAPGAQRAPDAPGAAGAVDAAEAGAPVSTGTGPSGRAALLGTPTEPAQSPGTAGPHRPPGRTDLPVIARAAAAAVPDDPEAAGAGPTPGEQLARGGPAAPGAPATSREPAAPGAPTTPAQPTMSAASGALGTAMQAVPGAATMPGEAPMSAASEALGTGVPAVASTLGGPWPVGDAGAAPLSTDSSVSASEPTGAPSTRVSGAERAPGDPAGPAVQRHAGTLADGATPPAPSAGAGRAGRTAGAGATALPTRSAAGAGGSRLERASTWQAPPVQRGRPGSVGASAGVPGAHSAPVPPSGSSHETPGAPLQRAGAVGALPVVTSSAPAEPAMSRTRRDHEGTEGTTVAGGSSEEGAVRQREVGTTAEPIGALLPDPTTGDGSPANGHAVQRSVDRLVLPGHTPREPSGNFSPLPAQAAAGAGETGSSGVTSAGPAGLMVGSGSSAVTSAGPAGPSVPMVASGAADAGVLPVTSAPTGGVGAPATGSASGRAGDGRRTGGPAVGPSVRAALPVARTVAAPAVASAVAPLPWRTITRAGRGAGPLAVALAPHGAPPLTITGTLPVPGGAPPTLTPTLAARPEPASVLTVLDAASQPREVASAATATLPTVQSDVVTGTVDRGASARGLLAGHRRRARTVQLPLEQPTAEPEQPTAEPERLTTAPEADVPPEPPPEAGTGDQVRAAPAPEPTTASGAPALGPQELAGLADALYPPLLRRMRDEILLDRERRGVRTDRS